MLIRGRVVPPISDNSSFMCYLRFDAKTARLFLAECARQLQKRLAQPLLGIHRHHVGDHLLLGDAHGQVSHEVFE